MRKVFDFLAVIVTAIAMLSVSTACFWILYQPKAPKCLTK